MPNKKVKVDAKFMIEEVEASCASRSYLNHADFLQGESSENSG